MAERSFYERTWIERLSDGAPFLGLLAGINSTVWWYDEFASVAWVVGIFVGALLVAAGVGQAGRYRRQRDTYRRALVALTRRCGEDQSRAYFAHLVPADVLTEAFPEEADRG